MLKYLAKGLLGRLLGYGTLTFGFWLLYRGFSQGGFPLALVGGLAVLAGMYLLVSSRRAGSPMWTGDFQSNEEDDPSDDPFDGSSEGYKLPP